MTNAQVNSVADAPRPAAPVVMAAAIVVGISGGGLVLVNPALARLPDPIPLATGVAPGRVTDGGNLPASLLLTRSLVTSDRLVPQASPQDPIHGFWRWFLRFFFFFSPGEPIRPE